MSVFSPLGNSQAFHRKVIFSVILQYFELYYRVDTVLFCSSSSEMEEMSWNVCHNNDKWSECLEIKKKRVIVKLRHTEILTAGL